MLSQRNGGVTLNSASMKVPPKRKGNIGWNPEYQAFLSSLNESPSEKEGK